MSKKTELELATNVLTELILKYGAEDNRVQQQVKYIEVLGEVKNPRVLLEDKDLTVGNVKVNNDLYNKFIIAKEKESIRKYASMILDNKQINKEEIRKYYINVGGKDMKNYFSYMESGVGKVNEDNKKIKYNKINYAIKPKTMAYIRKMAYQHKLTVSEIIRIIIDTEVDLKLATMEVEKIKL